MEGRRRRTSTCSAATRSPQRAGWYYPSPTAAFAALADHVALYPGRVDACTVDGEVVRPQPGGFYGGWVTDRSWGRSRASRAPASGDRRAGALQLDRGADQGTDAVGHRHGEQPADDHVRSSAAVRPELPSRALTSPVNARASDDGHDGHRHPPASGGSTIASSGSSAPTVKATIDAQAACHGLV